MALLGHDLIFYRKDEYTIRLPWVPKTEYPVERVKLHT